MNTGSENKATYTQAPYLMNYKPEHISRPFWQCEQIFKVIAAGELKPRAYLYFDLLTGMAGRSYKDAKGGCHTNFQVSAKFVENVIGISKSHQSEARKELITKGFISHSAGEFIQIEYHNILQLYGRKYYQRSYYTEDQLVAAISDYEWIEGNGISKQAKDANGNFLQRFNQVNPDEKRQNLYRGSQIGNSQIGNHNIEINNIEKLQNKFSCDTASGATDDEGNGVGDGSITGGCSGAEVKPADRQSRSVNEHRTPSSFSDQDTKAEPQETPIPIPRATPSPMKHPRPYKYKSWKDKAAHSADLKAQRRAADEAKRSEEIANTPVESHIPAWWYTAVEEGWAL